MKTTKNKIRRVIQGSNGYPNYTPREYLDTIRLVLKEELSNKELEYIKAKNINLDQLIMEITEEVTSDLF